MIQTLYKKYFKFKVLRALQVLLIHLIPKEKMKIKPTNLTFKYNKLKKLKKNILILMI
jgi:hypothetical protein